MALIDDLKSQISGALDQAYNQGLNDGKSGQAASDAAPVKSIENELHAALDKATSELSALQGSGQSASSADQGSTPAAPAASDNGSSAAPAQEPSTATPAEQAVSNDASGSNTVQTQVPQQS